MATAGIEPATFGMLVQRSANYSYAVKLVGVGDILELNVAPSIWMFLWCFFVVVSCTQVNMMLWFAWAPHTQKSNSWKITCMKLYHLAWLKARSYAAICRVRFAFWVKVWKLLLIPQFLFVNSMSIRYTKVRIIHDKLLRVNACAYCSLISWKTSKYTFNIGPSKSTHVVLWTVRIKSLVKTNTTFCLFSPYYPLISKM